MKNTSLFSLGFRDLVKGFLISVLTVVLTGVTTIMQDGGALPSETELKKIALAGLVAGIAYLTKNFLTNSNDQFVTRDPKDTKPKL